MLMIVVLVFWVRYHGDWRSEAQTVVSLLAFMHWLETGNLLMHEEAGEKLGCMCNLHWFFLVDIFTYYIFSLYLSAQTGQVEIAEL